MTHDEYSKFEKWFNEECTGISVQATDEYAQKQNKFYNFEAICEMVCLQCPELRGILTKRHICIIFASKHALAIGRGVTKRESMMQRHMDTTNYQKLLAAMDYEGTLKEGAFLDGVASCLTRPDVKEI